MTGDAVVQHLTDEQFERWMDLRGREMSQRDREGQWMLRREAMAAAMTYHFNPSQNTFRYGQEKYPTQEEVIATADRFLEWASVE